MQPRVCSSLRIQLDAIRALKNTFDVSCRALLISNDSVDRSGINANKLLLEQKMKVLKKSIWSAYSSHKQPESVVRKTEYEVVKVLEGHAGTIITLQFLLNDRIISGGGDKTIRIWDQNPDGSYTNTHILKGHTDRVITLQVLSDGRIVSGGDDSTIRIWNQNPDGSYAVTHILEGHTDRINTIQVLSDGRIISGGADNTIRIWDGKREE